MAAGELSLSTLTWMTKQGMRPFETRGELEGGAIGCGLDWLTLPMAAELRAGGGNRGIFTRVLSVEPIERGTQSARMAGVPGWFFDMIEAQDRRSNGGPPLDY
jgi:hypothetical protein